MLTSGVVSSHYLCSSFLLHASDKTGFLNEEQICSLLEKIIYPPLDCEETEDALQDMELRLHGHVKFECFLNWYTNESLVAAGDDCEETGQASDDEEFCRCGDSQESETSKVESKSELEVSPDPEPSIVMNQIASHEGSTGVGNTLKQNGAGHAFGNPRDLFDSVDRCVLSLYRASC
eukprot:SAG31_NODE_2450_length_5668_cov_32.512300_6_plen_177_part_00